MANANFQDRVQRIQANAAVQASTRAKSARGANGSNRLISLTISAVLTVTGGKALQYANENYEQLRDSGEMGVVLGFGVGGLILTLTGISMLFRALTGPKARKTRAVQDERKPSEAARLLFALIGFVTGAISCLYVGMASAASDFNTEAAGQFAEDGIRVATILLIVSLIFGLFSLFLRGRGLGRVPVYYFVGVAAVYAAFYFLEINLLEWDAFAAKLQ